MEKRGRQKKIIEMRKEYPITGLETPMVSKSSQTYLFKISHDLILIFGKIHWQNRIVADMNFTFFLTYLFSPLLIK